MALLNTIMSSAKKRSYNAFKLGAVEDAEKTTELLQENSTWMNIE